MNCDLDSVTVGFRGSQGPGIPSSGKVPLAALKNTLPGEQGWSSWGKQGEQGEAIV